MENYKNEILHSYFFFLQGLEEWWEKRSRGQKRTKYFLRPDGSVHRPRPHPHAGARGGVLRAGRQGSHHLRKDEKMNGNFHETSVIFQFVKIYF